MGIKIQYANTKNYKDIKNLFSRAKLDLSNALGVVVPIIKDVEKRGDDALKEYTLKFDGVSIEKFSINPYEAEIELDEKVKKAFSVAHENITNFHKIQIRKDMETIVSGNRLGIKFTPLESVAVYAPGGKALYPSSILMGTIPAKIAGVKEVNLITPPPKDGKLHPALLYASQISGVNKIYTIGGAQAIASVAYGTESVSRSEFVVGPGNRYVTAAKTYLAGIGQIGIESPAGPSEVLIIADDSANPEWIACDLLSQAEHGEDSIAILATNSKVLAEKVKKEIEIAFEKRPKRLEIKKRAIDENSMVLIFPSIDECIEFSNFYAPEHLEIITNNYLQDFAKIKHAGSVFLGEYSPVAMGDYISGTNHILPTAGGSRIYSSLGVDTFLKRVTYQEIKKESLTNLYPYVKEIAEIEGLEEEHGTSVKIRL
ncbi:MAG: histidinol dehydrogenase [Leptospiraceae bacterium]|nr:histidinol dehydrogenase [Leptospiraceae bacterium]MCP5498175.1 histidinol dehydrogenase [Leptospiraceae bacterium]